MNAQVFRILWRIMLMYSVGRWLYMVDRSLSQGSCFLYVLQTASGIHDIIMVIFAKDYAHFLHEIVEINKVSLGFGAHVSYNIQRSMCRVSDTAVQTNL